MLKENRAKCHKCEVPCSCVNVTFTFIMFQVGKSTTDPTKLGPLGKDISKIYNDIAKDTKGAVKTVGNPEVCA